MITYGGPKNKKNQYKNQTIYSRKIFGHGRIIRIQYNGTKTKNVAKKPYFIFPGNHHQSNFIQIHLFHNKKNDHRIKIS